MKVPQLNGGINGAVPAHLIDDNQLADAENMWFRDGMLKTRPALYCNGGDCQLINRKTADSVENCYVASDKFYLLDVQANKTYLYSRRADGGHKTHELTNRSQETYVYPWLCEKRGAVDGRTDPNASLLFYGVGDANISDLTGYIYAVEADKLTKVHPYVPTVIINGIPQTERRNGVNGTKVEPFNMLTGNYRCEYTTDGTGIYFRLPGGGFTGRIAVTYTNNDGLTCIHTASVSSPTEADVAPKDYHRLVSDPRDGVFWFTGLDNDTPLALAIANTTNNIKVEVTTDNSQENVRKIYRMRFSQWYGGGASGLTTGTRLFVSGNPEYPNLVHWSSLNNPLYFPENNYAYVGEDTKAITAFGKQGELLVIFKDGELFCTQYHQGETVSAEDVINQAVEDMEAAVAVFPMFQIHPQIGCDCPNTICLCNNRLVWANTNGKVYGLFTTGQYNERNVLELSQCVGRNIESCTDICHASAAEYENYYLLSINHLIFAMDFSSSGFTYYSSYSSDEKAQKAVQWHIWKVKEGRKFVRVFNCQGKTMFAERFGENGNGFAVYTLDTGTDRDSSLTVSEDIYGPSEITRSEEEPIACSFTTKLFDFDRPDVKKHIRQVYLSLGDESERLVRVSYLTEQWQEEDAFTAQSNAYSRNGITVWRLTPNAVRVRSFGLRCDCEGAMAVQGILLKYQYQGMVR